MNGKKKLTFVLVLIALLVLFVGATYAYFAVVTTSNYGTKTITVEAGDIGSVTLNGTNALLNLDLTAEDMSPSNTGTYYAGNPNKVKDTENIVTLGTASVSPNTDTNYYHCTYTLSVTHTGTVDMYDKFNHQTNNAYDYTNRSEGQVALIVNGVEYDWASTNGMPSTINGEFYIQGNETVDITAGLKFVNTDADQSYMAGTDININIGIVENSFTCSAERREAYAVRFNSNGGSGSMEDMTIALDESKNLTSNSFIRDNCTFKNWNTNSDGTGTSYLNAESVSNLTNVQDETVNLYAIWNCNIYFQLPPDWAGTDIYVYLYNSSNDTVKNYNYTSPTNDYKATEYESTKHVYKYIVEAGENIISYDRLIFNNNSYRKTLDLTFSASNIGKVYVPELYSSSNNTRVFFIDDVITADDSKIPYVYYWGGGASMSWPGEQLSASDKVSDKTYKVVLPNSITGYIVHNNSGNQTADLTLRPYQDLTFKNGSYFRRFYDGSWHDYNTWISTEYTTWYNGDYQDFLAAKNALGY